MPPLPKDPTARRRRNKPTTARVLTTDPTVVAPVLHIGLHPAVYAWWSDVWRSPMASAWDPSDYHMLVMLAELVNDFYQADSATARKEAFGEIRLQRARFGLDEMARRSLGYKIDRPDPPDRPAKPAPKTKPAAGTKTTKMPKAADPRLVLVS